METIRKIEPINRHNDKRKQFYEILFTYVFGRAGTVGRIGEEQYIQETAEQGRKGATQQIKGIYFSGIGFICSSGIDFDDPEGLKLIMGDDLNE